MKSPRPEDAKIMGMNTRSQTHLQRWGIVIGLTTVYWVSAIWLIQLFGDGVAMLAAIPIIMAGWSLGMLGGVIASLLAIILTAILLVGYGGQTWGLVLSSGFPFGSIIFILIGVITGRLRQILDARLQTEIHLRSSERYLTLLKITTNDILNIKNPGEKYYFLLNHLTNLFVADYGYFVHWDAAQEKATLITSTVQLAQADSKNIMESTASAMAEAVLQTGQILTINDAQNSHYAINPTPSKESAFPIQSMIGIPFMERGYKLGAAVLTYDTPHQFTPEEIEQAQQAGDQIALVLWTVQQEVEIQKRLSETNALANIARALSETERVGLSTVLQLIVNSTKELIPSTEQAVIHLLDEGQQILTAEAVIGYDEDSTKWKTIKIRPNEGVAGQVIVQGETINISDIGTDSRFVAFDKTPPSYRSLMVAPVQSGEKKLGTISVQSSLTDAFTEDESRLLSGLGTQAAIAIENANLLESTQLALKESNALYRINQKLVASLDPQELLQDVVELLQTNFEYYHVQIYTVEPKSGDFILHTGSGEIGKKLKENKHRLRAGEGIAGYTAEIGVPFFTNDVDQVYFFVRNPLLPNTKSELAVPVKIGENTLGVLDIQQNPPRTLSQRDIHLVSAVADQLSIALQKANLYSDLQVSLQTEKAIRDQLVQNERLATMGRLLASVSHELNNPLQAIQNALFLLREEKGISEQGKQDLDIVLSESERMAALIARLRATYRPAQAEDFQPMQVNDLIEDVYALIATHLRHNEISFEFYPADLPTIPGLADQIRQVLLNLLMNAVEAMTTGGRLTVSTQNLKDSDEILLRISDTGKGIDRGILPNIFDAFVTDKESGTGLGLTITYDIIVKHHGRIQAENNTLNGATFSVWLPCSIRESE